MKRHIIFLLSCLLFSCKHDPNMGFGTDRMLYNMALETNAFTWYKNNDVLLSKSGLSGHQYPLSRTRYNTKATNYLTIDKKVQDGIQFEDGSFIVKELYNASEELSLYAVMYKMQNHSLADQSGWLWAYIKPDGEVLISSDKKGENCTSCHGQTGSIDYSLINLSHP
jgi:hypothetical protein